MKMPCNRRFFAHHNWGRWEQIRDGDIQRWSATQQKTITTHHFYTQRRMCIDCHLVEVKAIRV